MYTSLPKMWAEEFEKNELVGFLCPWAAQDVRLAWIACVLIMTESRKFQSWIFRSSGHYPLTGKLCRPPAGHNHNAVKAD